jgi:hypothetical protein
MTKPGTCEFVNTGHQGTADKLVAEVRASTNVPTKRKVKDFEKSEKGEYVKSFGEFGFQKKFVRKLSRGIILEKLLQATNGQYATILEKLEIENQKLKMEKVLTRKV